MFVATLILLVALASFGLGRQSESWQEPLTVPNQAAVSQGVSPTSEKIESATYVASRNSDKYHLPWCSGAKRISEDNRIYFDSKTAAETAGYKPAANCPGI